MKQTAAEAKAKSTARRDLRLLAIIQRLLDGGSIGNDADWLNKIEVHAHAILQRTANKLVENTIRATRETSS